MVSVHRRSRRIALPPPSRSCRPADASFGPPLPARPRPSRPYPRRTRRSRAPGGGTAAGLQMRCSRLEYAIKIPCAGCRGKGRGALAAGCELRAGLMAPARTAGPAAQRSTGWSPGDLCLLWQCGHCTPLPGANYTSRYRRVWALELKIHCRRLQRA